MERDTIEHFQTLLDQQIKERFPDGSVSRVMLLQYGDDPRIEPGKLLVRVSIEAPAVSTGADQSMDDWEHAHGAMIREVRQELARKIPEATELEFVMESADGSQTARIGMSSGPSLADLAERARSGGGALTPVMARLGRADLETLDTLITAGIAPSRAEAVRWALARIRERPAYAKLRERTRELDELKSQF